MNSIQVGQLEILANCDLVAIKHREPKMHDATHTFTGAFESKEYWTQMTPSHARRLAAALMEIADGLDAIASVKSTTLTQQERQT